MSPTQPVYRRIAQLKTAHDFRAYLESLGIDLPFDEQVMAGPESPLGQPYQLKDGFVIGNRFCIHPMEGWDGTPEGKPSEYTFRRWMHFGESGAKLIWGGEAVAVRHDGRANPNQLLFNPENLPHLARLRQILVEAHEARYGTSRDLLVGVQLTHSGRFSRPNRKDRPQPAILYHHPYLDERVGLAPDSPVMSDAEIEALIECFVQAAEMARAAGFAFVDLKHCHGYLGHEFLGAFCRPGPFGGSFENRTRFLRETVKGIRARVPEMGIGVRLSAFDFIPFMKDPATGRGMPVPRKDEASYWFGAHPQDPLSIELDETISFLSLLEELGIEMVNLTAGSPYYNPHIQRPALFPPSDGYQPPEDPLVGVARQVQAVARLKARFPGLMLAGTGYSYLQEWLPNVAQYNVRNRRVDFVGIGRMVLAYPGFPADVLAGRPPDRKRLCRTFSDCTTAPRNGLISGCYPLDEFYKNLPEAEELAEKKKVK